MKQFLSLPLALVLLVSSASAERFVVSFNATVSFTDLFGKIQSLPQTKRTVIAFAPQGQDPRSLEMVYDTDLDQILIVKKSDGTAVQAPLSFLGGTTVANAEDTKRMRATLVKLDTASEASGSIAGPIAITRNTDQSLKTFVWTAKFHAGVPATQTTPAGVLRGTLRTGKKFVPTEP